MSELIERALDEIADAMDVGAERGNVDAPKHGPDVAEAPYNSRFRELAKTWRIPDGQPSTQTLDQWRIGQSIQQILERDLAAEVDARALYIEAAQHSESVGDRVSKIRFEQLTQDEKHHIDFLETQLELIRQIGAELYVRKHVGGLGN